MDSLSVSPERRTPVKVTYTGRNRRKRSITGVGQDVEVSDSSSGSQRSKAKQKVAASTVTKNAESEALDANDSNSSPGASRKGYRRLDFKDLPGPSPRHKRADSKELLLAQKQSMDKSTSSPLKSASPRSINKIRSEKPPSLLGSRLALAQLSRRAETPEIEGGMASSTTSSPKRRCSKSRLRKPVDVAMDVDANTVSGADDDASSIAPSVSVSEGVSVIHSGVGGIRRSLEERQSLLEQDPLAREVEPNQVLCEPCNKWIRLGSKTKYGLGQWQKHVERMHGQAGKDRPSRRVQEAERKLQLVNDPQAGEFSSSWVTCKSCKEKVQMSEKTSFDLTKWLEHKVECASSPTFAISDSPTREEPPSPQPDHYGLDVHADTSPVDIPVEASTLDADPPASKLRPPPSSLSTTSTDATVINPLSESPPSVVIGKKREREDDPEDMNCQSPTSRPRTESYIPIALPSPGPWGWFSLPWETFKKGFSEGFFSSSSS